MASGSPSEVAADLRHRAGVVVGQLEASVVAPDALHEQLTSRGLLGGAGVGLCREF